jgi:hypothetical protein
MNGSTMHASETVGETVSRIIRERRTAKVLAMDKPIEIPNDVDAVGRRSVWSAISDAGFAPFHYHRNVDGIAEPWRFYVLWQESCRELARRLPEWNPDMKPGNIFPAMLTACGCLILVYWIPQFDPTTNDTKQRQVDQEHLAATAAAIQNLLLSLTARDLPSYWSSGEVLRTDAVRGKLEIPVEQSLLGAVFVKFSCPDAGVEILSGKQRDARSNYTCWSKELVLSTLSGSGN